MKMVKSLLLGSAAGLVAVAGAQAADLPVKAKPVEYVKICSLYGDGFYYIPGSQTCLKISGYIRADYGYNVDTNVVHVYGTNGAQDRSRVAEGSLRDVMRSPPGIAPMRASIPARRPRTARCAPSPACTSRTRSSDDGAINTPELTVQRAFIQWAGFTLGRTASFVDPAGQMGDCRHAVAAPDPDREHHGRIRHQPDRLHLAARQRRDLQRRCRRRARPRPAQCRRRRVRREPGLEPGPATAASASRLRRRGCRCA